jgi:hygromycin-B 7''-O-kinase
LANGSRKTVKPEIAISVAQAQAIVDRAGSGRKVGQLSVLHGGEIGAVYEIRMTDGPPSLVLKIYPQSPPWKMQKEALVAAWLHSRLGVPVPRILLADDTKSVIDLNFVVMSKLEGDVLSRLEPVLTEVELAAAYSQMGRVLRQIHHVAMKNFSYIDPSGVWTPRASNRDYMLFQFEKKLAEFTERGGSSALADRLRAQRLVCVIAIFTAPTFSPTARTGRCSCQGFSISRMRLPAIRCWTLPRRSITSLPRTRPKGSRCSPATVQSSVGICRIRWRSCTATALWCWFAQIGNHQPLAKLTRALEQFG